MPTTWSTDSVTVTADSTAATADAALQAAAAAWSADSKNVTADSTNYTADGGQVVPGGVWSADSKNVTADSNFFTADGGGTNSRPIVVNTSAFMGWVEVQDDLDGEATLAWPACPGASGYNVYVNGVLKLTTTARVVYVAGLQQASCVNHTPLPSLTYTFFVTAILGGAETMFAIERKFTPAPTSVMFTTPMRRPWPFPNTGQTD